MSSRAGPRASGTDGSDFDHRERVAGHYRISAQLKPKIKICMLLNLFVSANIAALCGAIYLNLLPSSMEISKPQPWHYIIICSSLPSVIGLASLSRSNAALLNIYKTGSLLFCIGGALFGLIFQYKQFQLYVQTGKGVLIFGLPLIVIQYVALSLYIIFNLINFRYASKLSAAWNFKGSKTK
ncbi:protein jagunal homolog 1-like [Anneissia japonica]|uniref:protein jagunal homolog 1-like n=1 Tax=Anneissia japonica TaxID=1529436 RepID=UPI00142589A9|nr:protein jagunal homolog 1-like [Anneissia japonica]XP_033113243.1 protein jagunal homolog 1-like [Anneissia japonica]XP_033113244.1 protein jagunal homolog 1-like [Anneissia japonica]XP_033113245.1 protein jagunal homolog 1-like [Anneissia japonica]